MKRRRYTEPQIVFALRPVPSAQGPSPLRTRSRPPSLPCRGQQGHRQTHNRPPHHFLPESPGRPLKTPYIDIYTDPNSGSAGHWTGEPGRIRTALPRGWPTALCVDELSSCGDSPAQDTQACEQHPADAPIPIATASAMMALKVFLGEPRNNAGVQLYFAVEEL